jgi:hypothetical protein
MIVKAQNEKACVLELAQGVKENVRPVTWQVNSGAPQKQRTRAWHANRWVAVVVFPRRKSNRKPWFVVVSPNKLPRFKARTTEQGGALSNPPTCDPLTHA